MNGQEVPIAKLSELKSGEMKEVESGETKILLARVGDKCYAVGANCTHYGAPLVKGALVGERIVCPWHHACFDAANGDLPEPPALDALPNYKVGIKGDNIFVELPADGQTDGFYRSSVLLDDAIRRKTELHRSYERVGRNYFSRQCCRTKLSPFLHQR